MTPTVHGAEDLVHEGDGVAVLVDHAARGSIRHQALRVHTEGQIVDQREREVTRDKKSEQRAQSNKCHKQQATRNERRERARTCC